MKNKKILYLLFFVIVTVFSTTMFGMKRRKDINEKNEDYNNDGHRYKIRKIQEEQEEYECAICLENEEQKEELILQCGHIFHKECINEWFRRRQNNDCPCCREQNRNMFPLESRYINKLFGYTVYGDNKIDLFDLKKRVKKNWSHKAQARKRN